MATDDRPLGADPDATGSDIAATVQALSRPALAAIWQRAYRRPPPPGISPRLLAFAAAWHLQADREGGLARATRRRLARLAEQAPGKASKRSRADPRGSSALPKGTRLMRDWRGRTHAVDVVDTGFLYQGQVHRSLSAVARAITGARWSGPRFFGLIGQARQRGETTDATN